MVQVYEAYGNRAHQLVHVINTRDGTYHKHKRCYVSIINGHIVDVGYRFVISHCSATGIPAIKLAKAADTKGKGSTQPSGIDVEVEIGMQAHSSFQSLRDH